MVLIIMSWMMVLETLLDI
jgi:hypothetical protein